MDVTRSLPGSPTGGPLQAVTPERINQRRDSGFTPARDSGRESSVHEKISQFNNLSVSMQTKQLERRTADAALKRAMLGREEAEGEVRMFRDENKALRKAVEEGKDRERKVGERLETVMEQYGRAKETHAHTQALWEKEIRRARKENFKTQSTIVKLQEELKSSRSSIKTLEESLEQEKDRSRVREQEAFTARYQIVGVQEQLEQALERIKLVEQERDAYKTAAKNEEVARIAAEGRIPLPTAEEDDEFASPKKKKARTSRSSVKKEVPRVSLSTMEIVSSLASEQEIEELSTQVMWERQRANRAQEMIEFLQAECQMQCCPCSKSEIHRRVSMAKTHRQDILDMTTGLPDETVSVEMAGDKEETPVEATKSPAPEEPALLEPPQMMMPQSKKEARRSTIFCPREGIFRTVSEQEAEDIEAQRVAEEAQRAAETLTEVQEGEEGEEQNAGSPPQSASPERTNRMFARTPSVDPPAFALLAQERTSLDSLLNAPPHDEVPSAPLPSIRSVPTVPDEAPAAAPSTRAVSEDHTVSRSKAPRKISPEVRSQTSVSSYTVTTSVPIRDENSQSTSSFNEKLRTPSSGSNVSFDSTDPALTPTMTREQALAKIRERRGRARSVAQGTVSSQKKIKQALDRRDVSAPTGKVAGSKRPRP